MKKPYNSLPLKRRRLSSDKFQDLCLDIVRSDPQERSKKKKKYEGSRIEEPSLEMHPIAEGIIRDHWST